MTYSQKAAFEEGCALSLLRELGDPPSPIDPFALAGMLEIPVILAPQRHGDMLGGTIRVSARAPHREQCEQVAHELGHWCLHRYDVPDSEWGASYIGDALLLPRAAILRDRAELGDDVAAIMARHPCCSERVVRRRLAALDWQDGRAA